MRENDQRGGAEAPILALESVTKRFPGVVALDGVSLEVRPHEVIGLVGENGSGKSTLLKIVSGVQRQDEGRVLVRGEAVSFSRTADALARGIGMVFQEQSLVPALSVAENIFLGMTDEATRHGLYRWHELYPRARHELERLGLDIDPRTSTDELSFAQRQMVEIVKVLQLGRRSGQEPLVILDEPTSVLEMHEIEILFHQIERLRKEGSVIFVSHRLDEVLTVSDRVYVLRDGKRVGEGRSADLRQDQLLQLMVGRDLGGSYFGEDDQVPYTSDEPVLEGCAISVGASCKNVSFAVHPGEVVGIAGVVGSGREDLCRALFGAEPVRSGELRLAGQPIRFRSPAHAVRAGIGFVPSERRSEGVAMGLSVADNMVLAEPRAACSGPLLHRRRWNRLVGEWIDTLHIRPPKSRTDVGLLSGGNQQKVVLAKWLLKENLRVLILDHPARGLDIGAKEEVYRLVRDLAGRGMAVILLADTLEEVIALSHTVLVMKDGVVTKRFEAPRGAKPSQVDIVSHMV